MAKTTGYSAYPGQYAQHPQQPQPQQQMIASPMPNYSAPISPNPAGNGPSVPYGQPFHQPPPSQPGYPMPPQHLQHLQQQQQQQQQQHMQPPMNMDAQGHPMAPNSTLYPGNQSMASGRPSQLPPHQYQPPLTYNTGAPQPHGAIPPAQHGYPGNSYPGQSHQIPSQPPYPSMQYNTANPSVYHQQTPNSFGGAVHNTAVGIPNPSSSVPSIAPQMANYPQPQTAHHPNNIYPAAHQYQQQQPQPQQSQQQQQPSPNVQTINGQYPAAQYATTSFRPSIPYSSQPQPQKPPQVLQPPLQTSFRDNTQQYRNYSKPATNNSYPAASSSTLQQKPQYQPQTQSAFIQQQQQQYGQPSMEVPVSHSTLPQHNPQVIAVPANKTPSNNQTSAEPSLSLYRSYTPSAFSSSSNPISPGAPISTNFGSTNMATVVASAPSPTSTSPETIYRPYQQNNDGVVSETPLQMNIPETVAKIPTSSKSSAINPPVESLVEASRLSNIAVSSEKNASSSNASTVENTVPDLLVFEDVSTDAGTLEGSDLRSASDDEDEIPLLDHDNIDNIISSGAIIEDDMSNEGVESPKQTPTLISQEDIEFKLDDTSAGSAEGKPNNVVTEFDLLSLTPAQEERKSDVQTVKQESKHDDDVLVEPTRQVTVDTTNSSERKPPFSTPSPVDIHVSNLKQSPLAQRLHTGFSFYLHTQYGPKASSIFFEPDDGFRGAIYYCEAGRRIRSSSSCLYVNQIDHSVLSNAKFPVQNQTVDPQFSNRCVSLFDLSDSGIHMEFVSKALRDEFLQCLEHVIYIDGVDNSNGNTGQVGESSTNPTSTPPVPSTSSNVSSYLQQPQFINPVQINQQPQSQFLNPLRQPNPALAYPTTVAAPVPINTPNFTSQPMPNNVPPPMAAHYAPMDPSKAISNMRIAPPVVMGALPSKEEIYPLHTSIVCDMCNAGPIKGVRYRCTICYDFDLCAKCEKKGKHPLSHPLLKLNSCGLANDVAQAMYEAQTRALRDRLFTQASFMTERGQFPVVEDVRFNMSVRKAIDMDMQEATRLPPHVLQFLIEILVNLLTATDATKEQFSHLNLDDPGTKLIFAQFPKAMSILYDCGFEVGSKSDLRTPWARFEHDLYFNKSYALRIPEILMEKLLRIQGGGGA
jgi:hypothetical protein